MSPPAGSVPAMVADGVLEPHERHTLGALRYAVNEEAASYLAIMRMFTAGMSGLLSDQSAAEVAAAARPEQGLELDVDTVDARLSYLVEHGNLARSPRETEARSVREYLTNRARYQLTQRGELVHRQVEELLGAHRHGARGLQRDARRHPGRPGRPGQARRGAACSEADPRRRGPRDRHALRPVRAAGLLDPATSTPTCPRSWSATTSDRDEFQAFKAALLDYLQRFVDEIARHMPQIADVLRRLEPTGAGAVRARQRRAAAGRRRRQRRRARATGLDPADWDEPARLVRRAAGRDARRRPACAGWPPTPCGLCWSTCAGIAAGADRRAEPVRRPACGWPDGSTSRLTTRGARPVGGGVRALLRPPPVFAADDDADPVPPTASWWQTPVAHVPVSAAHATASGRSGGRAGRGRTSARPRARLAERQRAEAAREAALARDRPARRATLRAGPALATRHAAALLDLYARALSGHGRPLGDAHAVTVADARSPATGCASTSAAPGATPVSPAPGGRLVDLGLDLTLERRSRRWSGRAAGRGMSTGRTRRPEHERPRRPTTSTPRAELRTAARALLRTPLLHAGAGRDDDLRLVRRHRVELARLFADGLGYRLVVEPGLARLLKAGLGRDASRGPAPRNGQAVLAPRATRCCA